MTLWKTAHMLIETTADDSAAYMARPMFTKPAIWSRKDLCWPDSPPGSSFSAGSKLDVCMVMALLLPR